MGSFRFAICNEIFQGQAFEEGCRTARAAGYDGLELAPHTLAEDATRLNATERAELRKKLAGEGLEFVGLHWLLVSPPGLQITSADLGLRRHSWDYVHRAIELCADLASENAQAKSVMVFGSPKQRSARDPVTPQQGVAIFGEELARAAGIATEGGVTLLVEAIPSAETNVVTTLAEAAKLVSAANLPAVQTMFDVHNTADEVMPHGELLRRHAAMIRHVHVNERDGKEPGMGDYDFEELFRVLQEIRYEGWVSVEAFDFTRPPEDIAQRAYQRLKRALAG